MLAWTEVDGHGTRRVSPRRCRGSFSGFRRLRGHEGMTTLAVELLCDGVDVIGTAATSAIMHDTSALPSQLQIHAVPASRIACTLLAVIISSRLD